MILVAFKSAMDLIVINKYIYTYVEIKIKPHEFIFNIDINILFFPLDQYYKIFCDIIIRTLYSFKIHSMVLNY